MFNSISGTISGHDFPLLFLSSGNVEWELEVSATTFQAALAAPKELTHRVLVHLHAREDALKLYGFWTVAERRAFLELMKVPGIGPRQALRILSGTSVDALTDLLEREDVDALIRIPGLGKKTAQKMILQLKGHLVTETHRGAEGRHGADAGSDDELLTALVEMGFDRGRAQAVLEAIRTPATNEEDAAEPEEQEVFRRAIVELSGS